MLRNVFKASDELDEVALAASVQSGLRVFGVFAAALLGLAVGFAVLPLDPEGELVLVQKAVRLHLAGLGLSVVKCALAAGWAITFWQVFENSRLGRRTGNNPLVLAALLLGFAFIFGGR